MLFATNRLFVDIDYRLGIFSRLFILPRLRKLGEAARLKGRARFADEDDGVPCAATVNGQRRNGSRGHSGLPTLSAAAILSPLDAFSESRLSLLL